MLAEQNPLASEATCTTVLVAGARRASGATTTALGLAHCWHRLGRRVLLVDADAAHDWALSATRQAGIAPRFTLADVLSGRCDVEDAIAADRGQAPLLSAEMDSQAAPPPSIPALRRLARQAANWVTSAGLIVVDLGSQSDEAARWWWTRADAAYVVTLPDDASVMDAYGLIKRMHLGQHEPSLRLVVNQSASEPSRKVHRRLDDSCQRFLGWRLDYAGVVPVEAALAERSRAGMPVFGEQGFGLAYRAIAEIAQSASTRPIAVRASVAA
jgi:flagellar biosynthesis protein FlhG